jgi:hypothetical protein
MRDWLVYDEAKEASSSREGPQSMCPICKEIDEDPHLEDWFQLSSYKERWDEAWLVQLWRHSFA